MVVAKLTNKNVSFNEIETFHLTMIESKDVAEGSQGEEIGPKQFVEGSIHDKALVRFVVLGCQNVHQDQSLRMSHSWNIGVDSAYSFSGKLDHCSEHHLFSK